MGAIEPTLIHAFRESAKKFKHKNFLGHRDEKRVGRPYKWMTWGDAEEYVTDLARGLMAMDLVPEIEDKETGK